MAELIKEERYIFVAGGKERVFRVEELVWGTIAWPERFRILVTDSPRRDGRKVYGMTAREAVERAIEYLSSPVFAAGSSSYKIHASN
jgi:hypothetical protein